MYGLLVQISKYIFIALIYYFLFNFLKIMIADLFANQQSTNETGYYLLSLDNDIEYPIYPQTTVGRAQDSDIVIDDPFMSSKHALITKKGRRLFIQDLHSTNGTIVNGKKIKRIKMLKENDEIIIGSKKMRIVRREPGEVRSRQYLQ
mgnify:CR=1 FL=1